LTRQPELRREFVSLFFICEAQSPYHAMASDHLPPFFFRTLPPVQGAAGRSFFFFFLCSMGVTGFFVPHRLDRGALFRRRIEAAVFFFFSPFVGRAPAPSFFLKFLFLIDGDHAPLCA